MNRISELLKSPGTVVIDVRTPAEFLTEHFAGSINIPLGELPNRLGDLARIENIIVCCASGMRSQKAALLLKQNHIECYDAGPWSNIKNNSIKATA